jgi:hypothetical protein
MQSYDVTISPEQRTIMVDALFMSSAPLYSATDILIARLYFHSPGCVLKLSEDERALIESALNETFGGVTPPDVESEDAILFDMIRDLPAEEAANPGVLHGLCY